MRVRLWLFATLPLVLLAVALIGIRSFGGSEDVASAHVNTGHVHIELDAVQDAGNTWCNPVNPVATIPLSQVHKVAICLSDSPQPPGGFNIEVNYSGDLDSCADGSNTSPGGMDENPDANAGTTTFTTPALGTGCDCSSGGQLYPTCDYNPDIPSPKTAFISCTCSGSQTLPVGNGVSAPLAVITFSSKTTVGADSLTFGVVAVYNVNSQALVRCPRDAAYCLGATVWKGTTPTPPPPTPTNTLTPKPPTATPTNTNTPVPPTATFTLPPPTATFTPAPPTPTFTEAPPTATFTPAPTATSCPDDTDCDGVPDTVDNCPTVYNPDQLNSDARRRPNGPEIPGEWASNPATDKLGDACDPDDDNDGLPDAVEFGDHCPYRTVADSDGDGAVDGFEVANGYDPCNPASRPTWVGGADGDSDGLIDVVERGGYNTCAFIADPAPGWSSCAVPQDSDGDGCSDTVEVLDLNGDRTADSGDQFLLDSRIGRRIPADPVSDAIFDVNKDGFIDSGDQLLMNAYNCPTKRNQIGCPMCPPG
jgi:hypothetical protein